MKTRLSVHGGGALAACTLLACGIVTSAADGQQAAAPQRQGVLNLESRLAGAFLKRDLAFLDSVLADDLVQIGADGTSMGKQDYLKEVKENRVYSAYVPSDIVVRQYGNVAIADGVEKVAGVFDGNRGSAAFVASRVWVYRMNRWQIILWQATMAPPPRPDMLLKKLQSK